MMERLENAIAFGEYYEHLQYKLREALGLCACGLPEQSLYVIARLLVILETERLDFQKCHLSDSEKFKALSNKYDSLRQELITKEWDAVLYILYNLLDQKGILEHGGSLPGWINDTDFCAKMGEFLNLYEEICKQEEEQDAQNNKKQT